MCSELVGQLQSVAELLPDALVEEIASTGLRERILSVVGGEEEVDSPTAEDRRASRLPRWLAPRATWAAAATAVLVAALVAWNVTLQLRLDDQDEAVPTQAQLIEAIATGATVTILTGTEAAPESVGTLVQSAEDGLAFLLIRNLPPLRADQEYQVWRIEADVPISAGTFVATGAETQLVRLEADFSAADAIGVSRERKGGSASPTAGAIVLLGAR